MPKIKLGFVTDDIDRPAMGTALYMQKLIEQFVENFSDKIDLWLIHREGKCTVPVCKLAKHLTIKTFNTPKFSGILSWPRFFLFSKEKFDIIHFPRPNLYPFFWKAKAKKFVVTFHDAPEKGAPRFRAPANYFWEWHIKLWTQKYIDAALGASVYSAQTIWRYYNLDPSRTFGVPNGGGGEMFKSLTNEEKKAAKTRLENRYKIKPPYILQVARLVPHKNVHRVVLAFSILKQRYKVPHKLVILGGKGHAPAYDNLVIKCIKESSVSDEIYIAPFIENEDMNVVYNLADIFIQVGLSDGFSIPIVDALNCGLPVVTSNLSVFPEMVGDAGILVNPYDPEDIAEGMIRLINNNDLRVKLTQLGLEKGKQYSWFKTAINIFNIYKRILKDE